MDYAFTILRQTCDFFHSLNYSCHGRFNYSRNSNSVSDGRLQSAAIQKPSGEAVDIVHDSNEKTPTARQKLDSLRARHAECKSEDSAGRSRSRHLAFLN